MKLNAICLSVLCAVTVVFTGCYSTVDGRVKAGMPFAKDSIPGCYERSVPQVFEASKKVLARLGTLVSEDTINKVITAKVDTRNVWIKVTDVDKTVTRVMVQVRTHGGGTDIELAAQIDKEIALQLAQTR
jgi:hypothetical protein